MKVRYEVNIYRPDADCSKIRVSDKITITQSKYQGFAEMSIGNEEHPHLIKICEFDTALRGIEGADDVNQQWLGVFTNDWVD